MINRVDLANYHLFSKHGVLQKCYLLFNCQRKQNKPDEGAKPGWTAQFGSRRIWDLKGIHRQALSGNAQLWERPRMKEIHRTRWELIQIGDSTAVLSIFSALSWFLSKRESYLEKNIPSQWTQSVLTHHGAKHSTHTIGTLRWRGNIMAFYARTKFYRLRRNSKCIFHIRPRYSMFWQSVHKVTNLTYSSICISSLRTHSHYF